MHFDYSQYKQKGFAPILILVGILVIMAVSAGAYYFGRSTTPKSSPTPGITSQVTPTPSASPAPTGAGDNPVPNGTGETTNWKTYTNTKYGYSLKYPADWMLEEGESSEFQSIALTKTDTSQAQVLLPGDTKADVIYKIDTRVNTNPKGLTTRELLLQNISPESIAEYEKTLEEFNLNGFPAIKHKEACAPCSGMELIVTLTHSDKIYSLSYGAMVHEETHDKFLSTFNQILSTFKFTQ